MALMSSEEEPMNQEMRVTWDTKSVILLDFQF